MNTHDRGELVLKLMDDFNNRLVFWSPSNLIFETTSTDTSEKSVEVLNRAGFDAYTVNNRGNSFVSVPL